LLTFFVWPGGFGGKTGTGQTSHTAYAIPVSSLSFWRERLNRLQLPVTESTRFGQQVLSFQDPDGMNIELVASATGEANPETTWATTEVPAEHAIRGFHSVTLSEVRIDEPSSVLVNYFGYRLTSQEGNRYRFEVTSSNSYGTVVDVIAVGERKFSGGGAGSVHHVAFRTPNDEQHGNWFEFLSNEGAQVSPIIDRDYFHSIYFREPGGVLFEVATDNPGMAINESVENLGTRLILPAAVEHARAQIEKVLPPIELAGQVTVPAK
jgi:glyoxalase family protein